MANRPEPHGNGMRVRWRYPRTGKWQSITVSTVEAADALYRLVQGRYDDLLRAEAIELLGGHVRRPLAPREPTFGAFAEEVIAKSRANATTKAGYRGAILSQFEPWLDLPLSAITEEVARARVTHWEMTLAPLGANHIRSLGSRVLGAAVRKGLTATNPLLAATSGAALKPKRQREYRFLTHDQFGLLMRAARPVPGVDHELPILWEPEVMRAALLMMVGLGLRVNEVLGQQARDVFLTSRTVRVTRQQGRTRSEPARRPKWGSAGTLAASRSVIAAVEPLIKRCAPADPVLTLHGQPYLYSTFLRHWNRLVQRAQRLGLDVTPTPHDLRHTAGSWLLDRGRDLFEVSKFLRHKSITMTADIYLGIMETGDDRLRDAMDEAIDLARRSSLRTVEEA